MKAMINRVFSWRGGPASVATGHSALSSELCTSDIENYYLTIIVDALRRTHFAGLWFQASSGTEGSPKSLLGLPCELIHQPRSTAIET